MKPFGTQVAGRYTALTCIRFGHLTSVRLTELLTNLKVLSCAVGWLHAVDASCCLKSKPCWMRHQAWILDWAPSTMLWPATSRVHTSIAARPPALERIAQARQQPFEALPSESRVQ